ncbi:MAG: DUF559 domain-containing protein [Bacteroidetes bacterium]|nr:DUF559 domain-containing protein [Bacteroidota bacterium]
MNRKEFRRQLRKDQTSAESSLWSELRNRRLKEKKFRRQHSLGKYTVDFFCFDEKLVIEVDGKSHDNIGSQNYDFERDNWLKKRGYRVLRFTNQEVYKHLDRVLWEIEDYFTSPL